MGVKKLQQTGSWVRNSKKVRNWEDYWLGKSVMRDWTGGQNQKSWAERWQAGPEKADVDFQKSPAFLKVFWGARRAVVGKTKIDFRNVKGDFGRKWNSFMRIAVGGSTEHHDPNSSLQESEVGKKCHISAGSMKVEMSAHDSWKRQCISAITKIMERNVHKTSVTTFSSKWSDKLMEHAFRALKGFTIELSF